MSGKKPTKFSNIRQFPVCYRCRGLTLQETHKIENREGTSRQEQAGPTFLLLPDDVSLHTRAWTLNVWLRIWCIWRICHQSPLRVVIIVCRNQYNINDGPDATATDCEKLQNANQNLPVIEALHAKAPQEDRHQ